MNVKVKELYEKWKNLRLLELHGNLDDCDKYENFLSTITSEEIGELFLFLHYCVNNLKD